MESFFIGRRISTLKGTARYPNEKKNDTKEHDERADVKGPPSKHVEAKWPWCSPCPDPEDRIGEKGDWTYENVNLGSQSPYNSYVFPSFEKVFVKIGWSGRILMVRHAPELFAGGYSP